MTFALLSRPVEIAEVRRDGTVACEVVADATERAALADAYDVPEVAALTATATLTAEADGGVDVAGRVVADIVQTCVVSLVPVEQHIDEPFQVRFVPPESRDRGPPPKPRAEVVVDPAAPDPPEVMSGPAIDVGAVVE